MFELIAISPIVKPNMLRFCWIFDYFFFVAQVAFISFTLHQKISFAAQNAGAMKT